MRHPVSSSFIDSAMSTVLTFVATANRIASSARGSGRSAAVPAGHSATGQPALPHDLGFKAGRLRVSSSRGRSRDTTCQGFGAQTYL